MAHSQQDVFPQGEQLRIAAVQVFLCPAVSFASFQVGVQQHVKQDGQQHGSRPQCRHQR